MRFLCYARTWLWSALSWMAWVASGLQGPDITGPTRTNFLYSPFAYQGPNSLTAMGPGPQSVGNIKRVFLTNSPSPRHRRMNINNRSNFGIKGGRRGPRVLFADSHYKYTGSDGEDPTDAAGRRTNFKFDNSNSESLLSGDLDDDCDSCQSLIPHPCCLLRTPPQRGG